MIHHLDDVRQGFDVDADVVIIGSGAGGAVAATNFAAAGLRTVLLEAGPQISAKDMTRDGPAFMARHYWEGGLRLLRGTGPWPTMSGRILGGSTVINSAIMFPLPAWVREDWAAADGLDALRGPELDAAYARVFARTHTAPTPESVFGKRNVLTREILDHAGLKGAPLPRAVKGCQGTGDCLTGCAVGAKQSVDRSYLPGAVQDGAEVYTCAVVHKIRMEGTRAVGVEGHIVDPDGHAKLARFTVRAPRVIVSAGTLHTPVILKRSGVTAGGRVGGTFLAHISSFAMGVMNETVDPWIGATQGYGAFSDRVRGLKFESLWAPSALIGGQWGGVGPAMYEMLPDFKRALMIPIVYRAKVTGKVGIRLDGMPDAQLWVPPEEMWVVLSELKRVVDSMLDLGAEYVYTGVRGLPAKIRTKEQALGLLSHDIQPRDVTMTANHTFGSCRMSGRADRGVVDVHGKVYGTQGLWLMDASVFPSPSAVNPQATIMALADLNSRRIADMDLLATA